jgi:hypothetical protein
MNIFLSILTFLTLVCGGISAGGCYLETTLMRKLQHEIDKINISLNERIHTNEEIEFLKGKSCGIFLCMEIIHEVGDL